MKFVDRQRELWELNQLLASKRGQFVVTYGRRRVGKTTLLLHWTRQGNTKTIYWMARREPAAALRQSLARAIWQWAYPDEPLVEPPIFTTWEQLFAQLGRMVADQQVIMIFDEFSYAVEADSSLPSHVQAAWDHIFKEKMATLVLAGSHIGMMVDLLNYDAPLYGRTTAQFHVEPLPFAVLAEFFPAYSAAERVATYAVIGGIPAYLERFDGTHSLSANIRHHLFQRTGMFRSEPAIMVSDLVRETRTYETILRAVGTGAHTPAEIAKSSSIAAQNLSPYLRRLRDLGLLERRIPATTPPTERRTTTRSRYHLRDPYLRFYFRFIEPNLEMIEMGLEELLWERIGEQFRAFIGGTVFEELCREWVLLQAQQRRLPFTPELVGTHWAIDAQVDVVAINWREKQILLGECKWGANPVGKEVITKLIEIAPNVRPSEEWQVHYVFFARAGFSAAAQNAATAVNAQLVDLAKLDDDLQYALAVPSHRA